MNYKQLSDEELASLAQQKNTEAMETLITRYRYLVTSVAHSYFLTDGDVEDLVQVGQIGVFNAIISFNGKVDFKYYVTRCVKNSVISAIKKSNTKKNYPLNNYISLSGYLDSDVEKNGLLADVSFEPEERFVNLETVDELKSVIIKVLSKYENEILSLYLQGYSYTEIGEKLNKNSKSIDNALQRIKKKISLKINLVG